MVGASFPSAAPFLPERSTLTSLREAAESCRGCALYRNATQVVFGEGSSHSRLMLIGETPGDQEDQTGRPFVGPAGKLLDEALQLAGIDRGEVYVTNAVKHFKWEPRGKRRLHAKPSAREIMACRPWLEAELSVVAPLMIVCLGATAAQALLGRKFRITQQRGTVIEHELNAGRRVSVVATWHPAAVLRAPDEAGRRQKKEEFLSDVKLAVAQRDAINDHCRRQ